MKKLGITLNGKEYIVTVREIIESNDTIIDTDTTNSGSKDELNNGSSSIDTETKNEDGSNTTDTTVENTNGDIKQETENNSNITNDNSDNLKEDTDKITDDTDDKKSVTEEVNPSEKSDSNNDELEGN